MSMVYARLTVFFEEPFWVGLYEREEGGAYTVCKLVFGAEPRDCEVGQLLQGWRSFRFSPPVAAQLPAEREVSPKRRQREIHRELERAGAGTKAQQALALARGLGKEARCKKSRAERETEEKRRFALRQAKRKEKRKGH